jgi:hypothetical protein
MKLSFKEGRESAMSMVVEVGQGEGEGDYGDSLGEPRYRGKCLETLMPQEPLHMYKLE